MELLSTSEPTSDVSDITVTGLSGYHHIRVVFMLAPSDNADHAAHVRIKETGGTQRSVATIPSGRSPFAIIDMWNFGGTEPTFYHSFETFKISQIDRSDNTNVINDNFANNAVNVDSTSGVLTYGEDYDEIEFSISGTNIEGSDADHRGIVLIYGK